MTDIKGNNNNREKQGDLFEQFPVDEQSTIKRIWGLAGRLRRKTPELSEDEVEGALSDLHGRLDRTKNYTGSAPIRLPWKAAAAAAVIMLAVCLGMLLFPQTESAPNGEMVTLELPDGSSVELNSGTRLRYNRLFAYTNRNIRLNGEAFFLAESGEEPFVVRTNAGVVEVTGTEFNVRSWNEDPGGETEVTVSEGSVRFYPDSRRDSAVTVTPGQRSRLTAAMVKPAAPEPVSVEQITAWRKQMLIFNDKSLMVIFNELERRFDVEIRLEHEAVARETLTAFYAEPKGVEPVLQDICRVKGLRYSETATGYRVYR